MCPVLVRFTFHESNFARQTYRLTDERKSQHEFICCVNSWGQLVNIFMIYFEIAGFFAVLLYTSVGFGNGILFHVLQWGDDTPLSSNQKLSRLMLPVRVVIGAEAAMRHGVTRSRGACIYVLFSCVGMWSVRYIIEGCGEVMWCVSFATLTTLLLAFRTRQWRESKEETSRVSEENGELMEEEETENRIGADEDDWDSTSLALQILMAALSGALSVSHNMGGVPYIGFFSLTSREFSDFTVMYRQANVPTAAFQVYATHGTWEMPNRSEIGVASAAIAMGMATRPFIPSNVQKAMTLLLALCAFASWSRLLTVLFN